MNKFSKALQKQAMEKRMKQSAKAKSVPLSSDSAPTDNADQSASGARCRTVIKNDQVDQSIVALHDPRSNISEQYRTLRTNLKSVNKNKTKSVLISSPEENDGKTVTAINLAYTFAHDKTKNVLLVDADLRRSKVADYLGISTDLPGFTEILEGTASFEDSIVCTELENLHVIIGHTDGSAHNATELLESKTMQKCLDQWEKEYDYIVLDSPPILPVTDAAVLGAQTDGVLMVIKAGKSQKNTIKHAQQMFEQAGVHLLGYIMTHVDHLSPGNRDYYYSYYRY